jgi:demethylmenaquinone methyltransferase/2-methoxy-6-polyprenyl-1,4-benzoquinol methylase
MTAPHTVRGQGPLDEFLAKRRYKIAGKLIESVRQRDRVLDIGCGSYPLFLTTIDFSEKYGMDKMVQTNQHVKGITLINYDLENEEKLPYENDFFDVVSALAVFEHIKAASLVQIHREIHRILKPGGVYIMTTPAFWTDRLLKFLAKIRLISDIEIKDHKGSYKHSDILSILQKADFQKEKIKFGHFEMFMNTWATAVK